MRLKHHWNIILILHFPDLIILAIYFNQKSTLYHTLFKSSRIYTGQYTFPILLLNDDNMLGEHKGGEKNIVYGRLF